jgi:hypothetical protein
MEHKSYLIGGTLLVVAFVLCLNWYTGLDSYILEEDITDKEYFTYQEALNLGLVGTISPDRDYYKKYRYIVTNKKTMIPLVFKKDTIFRKESYHSTEKYNNH